MTSDNIAIVRDLYEAFGRRDLPAIHARLAPDVTVETSSGLPWSGSHSGPDGFVAFLGTLLSHLETHVEMDTVFDAGDVIFSVGHGHGRILANGVEFQAREVHCWRIEDGQVKSFQVWVDVPAMRTALSGTAVGLDGPVADRA